MYTFSIYLYSIAVYIAALFGHKKARKLIKGHILTWKILKEKIDKTQRYIWFHASSLGEFEQGRPLIERIRREHPEKKILLTFFSPSGYEVRKNYNGADIVCYLPFDTRLNAKAFVHFARPEMVFFIKYEFWRNYINELSSKNIPIYSVSSIFRDGQIFFSWYGWWYKYMMRRFTHFFVQDEKSKELLHTIGVDQVTVAGDTRFDRVIDIMHAAKPLPLVEKFALRIEEKKDAADAKFTDRFPILVAGSSWPVDEEFIIPYFNQNKRMKLVLAPHIVSEQHIAKITAMLQRPYVRYTEATPDNVQQADCLIIDCFGLLSSIYRYATVAYVGGGFGVGIHNVPEAAVYGIPVIIGPNNKNFLEARTLLENGGCKQIDTGEDFAPLIDRFFENPKEVEQAGDTAGHYISDNAGAADMIYKSISF